jgi:hypothetical protein
MGFFNSLFGPPKITDKNSSDAVATFGSELEKVGSHAERSFARAEINLRRLIDMRNKFALANDHQILVTWTKEPRTMRRYDQFEDLNQSDSKMYTGVAEIGTLISVLQQGVDSPDGSSELSIVVSGSGQIWYPFRQTFSVTAVSAKSVKHGSAVNDIIGGSGAKGYVRTSVDLAKPHLMGPSKKYNPNSIT